jgi:large subunit ribosomal protein L15
MQLHEARRADLSNKKKIRVGRGPGSGLGKTAGRGIKGATSRSGYAMKVTYEGGQMPLFRRLPKRGFRNGPFREHFSVVNISELADFAAGSKVGPDELREAGLARGPARNLIKILGDGEIKVALTISADAFSKSAIEKIQKAGGKAEWIGGAPKKPAPDFKKIAEEKRKKAAAEKPKAEAKGEAKGGGAPAGGGDAKAQAKGEAGGPKPEGGKPKAAGKPEGGKPAGDPKAPKAEKPADEGGKE